MLVFWKPPNPSINILCCFIYSNAINGSEPDEKDQDEIESFSSADDSDYFDEDNADDDDHDSDHNKEESTNSGMTSSDESGIGNTITASYSSSQASQRSM